MLEKRKHGLYGCALFALFLVQACWLENQGVAPPPQKLNFPVALLLVPKASPRFLLAVSSNFDLRYRAGSLHVLSVQAMEQALRNCGKEFCTFEELGDFVVSEALIGSHASDIALSSRGDRVYLPVRSEVDLTWIDVDPESGALFCEGTGQPQVCAPRRRSALRGGDCGAQVDISGDPVTIAVGRLAEIGGPKESPADYILMAHRNGRVTLFVEREIDGELVPVLVDAMGGLPNDVVNASFDAESGRLWTHSAFVSAFRPVREIASVVAFADGERPGCARLAEGGRLSLVGVDDGLESRDALFREGGRRIYLLMRRPEALLFLEGPARPFVPWEARPARVAHVGSGPAQLEAMEWDGRRWLVVSCFDDRRLWFIDGERGSTQGVLPGVQGPYALAFDPERKWLWVADFRESVLYLVDVAPLAENQEPRLVARFGRPRPAQVLR
ncbi:MAG: hypothetical protein NZM37_01795 [Sandaracinaceae bacterium]|nr:hypothetical protein [Sandaracinaceae bacterium]